MFSRAARRLVTAAFTAAAISAVLPALSASAATTPAVSAGRAVMLIGNSASGTVSFLDAATFRNLGSLNVTPDAQRVVNGLNPIKRIGYESVSRVEGGVRYVDDVYASPDGRTLYLSRGELQDATAFDIASGKQLWRTDIEGFKTDHAVLSPDGRQFVVSATTAQKAVVLDTATGKVLTSFPTGTYPHANDYSPDGTRLYNSSIGVTSLPQMLDGLKGDKTITVVDPKTYKVLRTYRFDEGVRPAVYTRDNALAYIQLSYFNGFVEYDLAKGAITRRVPMPFSAAGKALSPDSYPQNSAHHGMAINGDESALCDVGTIDDYTAIVARPSLTTRGTVTYPTGSIPYWSTTAPGGNLCFVTLSGRNEVSVIDYASAREVARVAVGAFPQRERNAVIPDSVLATLNPAKG